MIDWFRRQLKPPTPPRTLPTNRELLVLLVQRNRIIMADLAKLNAAVDRNTKAIAALAASHADPATQAGIDTAVTALDASSKVAEDAVAPAAAPEVAPAAPAA